MGKATKIRKPFVPTKGTLAALLLASMMNCMGGAAVAPALPVISEAFPAASETLISLVITLPSLAVVCFSLPLGAVADRMGKARTLIVSLVIFTLAGFSALVLPSIELILVGRFIMGIGIAGAATATTALVTEYYDMQQRPRVMGLQSAATGMSVLVLETLGGYLALLGWRVPFFVYFIGVVMLVFALLFVREPYHGQEHEGSSAAKSGESSADASVGQLVACGGLSKRAVVVLSMGCMFLTSLINFMAPSKMPYYVTSFGGDTALAGWFLAAYGTANVLGSLAYAPLYRRFGRFKLVVVSFAILMIGLLFFVFGQSVWAVPPGIVLMGAGGGVLYPLATNWLSTITTPQNSGRYMSIITMASSLGQFVCTLIAGAIIDITGSYGASFGAWAVVSALVLVLCAVYRLRHPRRRRA